MNWMEIRRQFPRQWLLVEAIKAHSDSGKRIIDQLSVIDAYRDSDEALRSYQELHHESPSRELYVLHTDRERLDISERNWLGIRGAS